MIYFILNRNLNHIKIGYSKEPNKRIKTLQTGSSEILELYAYFNGDIPLEKFLHKKFKKYHFNNEWFIFDDNIKEFIYFLNNQNITNNYIYRYFDLMDYTTDLLFEIFRIGIYYKSYFNKELLTEYEEYFKEKINPTLLLIGKSNIIRKIFDNKLDYKRLIDDLKNNINDDYQIFEEY